jgi:hypothetical protein
VTFPPTQLDLLWTATRFEIPGKAVMWKSAGMWVVTDGDGCRTSHHVALESATREFCRLSEQT